MYSDENETGMDGQIREVFTRAGMDSPSEGFTRRVMDEVVQVQTVKAYKPVISRKAWWVIGVLLVGLFGYIYWSGAGIQETGILASAMDDFKARNLMDVFGSISTWIAGIQLSLALKISISVVVGVGLLELAVYSKIDRSYS